MERERKKKIMIIGVLLALIFTFSIGFAAYSAVLTINPRASVNPKDDLFNIVFSASGTRQDFGNIRPSLSDSIVSANDAYIIDDGLTLSNIKVHFTKLGQKVTYNFWVHNAGAITAYLDSVDLGTQITCTSKASSDNPATQSIVDKVCDSMYYSLKVNNKSIDVNKSALSNGITYNTGCPALDVDEYMPVEFSIYYSESGSYSDGDFEVDFGEIKFNFTSVPNCETSSTNPPKQDQEYENLVDYLLSKANSKNIKTYTAGDKSQMYVFDHEKTEQTGPLTDYRYIGNEPNNYVNFNDEVWRIIGVFEVEDGEGHTEQRVKIIRGNSLKDNMSWDSTWKNNWSTATLNTYFNGEYYDSLSTSAQTMIGNTKYYLGQVPALLESPARGSTYIDLSWQHFYKFERGTTMYSNNSIDWVGKIALMYPSDYLYTYALGVNETCFENGYMCKNENPLSGWIFNSNINDGSSSITYQRTLSPVFAEWDSAFIVERDGRTLSGCTTESTDDFGVGETFGVRPALYLKADVVRTDGDGSIGNPYSIQ